MSKKWKGLKDIISAEQLCRFTNISRIKEEEEKTQNVDHRNFLFEEQKYLFSQSEFPEQEFETLARKILDLTVPMGQSITSAISS